MDRIQISDYSDGDSPTTLPLNPFRVDFQDTENQTSIEVLHGSRVWQQRKWDDRPRELVWVNLVATTYSNFISSLQSGKGDIKYFNFKDLDEVNRNWPTVDTWKKARIIDAFTKVSQGGRLVYSSFTLVIQPEQ